MINRRNGSETWVQSTGKTTLCNALAKELNLTEAEVVKEVARHVMATQGWTRNDIGSVKMQQAIIEAHLKAEEGRESCPILLCDRSAIDAIAYAIMTSPTEAEAQRRQDLLVRLQGFESALQKYRNSIFVLLAPVPEWLEDDGIRSIENQSKCFDVFHSLLEKLGVPFRVIGPEMKSLDERVTAMKGLLGL